MDAENRTGYVIRLLILTLMMSGFNISNDEIL